MKSPHASLKKHAKALTITGLIVGISTFLGSLFSFASFGKRPTEEDKKSFLKSKQWSPVTGTFQNRLPRLVLEMEKNMNKWRVAIDFLFKKKDRSPPEKLPEMTPDMASFLSPSSKLKIIWFGHSSFLLNMDGKIILVDPVFSPSAAPVSFMVQRFQAPILTLSQLPKIDYILISHDHYDHLDMESIKHFKDKTTKFITPLGVSSHLKSWGVPLQRIIEKDWWESYDENNIKFTATPAQHFSGRSGFDKNCSLWASWVIKSENSNIYFSGDSGYDVHFKEIGEKLGPFDVAFLESGQYNQAWREVHMLPEEAVKAFFDLKARSYFPVHWGMFVLSLHSWFEPIEKIFKFSREQNFTLLAPKIGQIVTLGEKTPVDPWWELVGKEAKRKK